MSIEHEETVRQRMKTAHKTIWKRIESKRQSATKQNDTKQKRKKNEKEIEKYKINQFECVFVL